MLVNIKRRCANDSVFFKRAKIVQDFFESDATRAIKGRGTNKKFQENDTEKKKTETEY